MPWAGLELCLDAKIIESYKFEKSTYFQGRSTDKKIIMKEIKVAHRSK